MSTGCPNSSYGSDVCGAIMTAKDTFRYIYGIKSSTPAQTYRGIYVTMIYQNLEILIASTMFRKGLLLSKNDMMLAPTEQFSINYNNDTGVLTHILWTTAGVTLVKFLPNAYGRQALIDNFYSVSNIKPQIGVKIEHLTREEFWDKMDKEFQEKINANQRDLNKKRK